MGCFLPKNPKFGTNVYWTHCKSKTVCITLCKALQAVDWGTSSLEALRTLLLSSLISWIIPVRNFEVIALFLNQRRSWRIIWFVLFSLSSTFPSFIHLLFVGLELFRSPHLTYPEMEINFLILTSTSVVMTSLKFVPVSCLFRVPFEE